MFVVWRLPPQLPGKDNARQGSHVPLANAAECSVVAPRDRRDYTWRRNQRTNQ
jgi:hypothetical protein